MAVAAACFLPSSVGSGGERVMDSRILREGERGYQRGLRVQEGKMRGKKSLGTMERQVAALGGTTWWC